MALSRVSGGLSAIFLLVALCGFASSNSRPQAQAAVQRGRVMYEQHCAACHGKDGKGNGPVAATMTTRPTDLTRMEKRNGAFFAAQAESAIRGTSPVVAHGAPGMMVWGAIFRAAAHGNEAAVDARIRDLVAFIESIQEKQ